MSDHAGLPEPFYDGGGLPLCLSLLRDEVVSRGGRIVGAGLAWRVVHPDSGLPDIEITFYDEGDVLVSCGPSMWVEEFCSADRKWWARGVWGDCPYTWVESAVLAFVTGGAVLQTWTDGDGKERSLTIADGPCLTERGGYGKPPSDGGVTQWRYPAWPVSAN